MIEACKELWIASKMHDNLVSGRIYSYVLVRTRTYRNPGVVEKA